MAEEKNAAKLPHNLVLEDRQKLTVTGVTDVDSFDEESVILYTADGQMRVEGRALQMTRLSLESGDVTILGEVSAIIYKGAAFDKGGFFSRLVK